MAAQIAPAPPPPRRDRTTLVVRLGLLALFLLGVLTVFGESLVAAVFPPGEPATTNAPATVGTEPGR